MSKLVHLIIISIITLYTFHILPLEFVPFAPFCQYSFQTKNIDKRFKILILKYFKKCRYFFIHKCNLEFGIIKSTLSPSCVALTLHHQNRNLCPELRITKKIHTSNQESFRKSVFKVKKQKAVFLTVQPYSGTKKPYILLTT